ncbi:uncharacterized protein PSANT_04409 [Moesziomyces antarcticus]|uniref:Uncharacterized protein n=1 Tax=Pseudozyma antarctica TaxID=84753 RepID=A0A5C3FQL2_PSEA2|nr:uncharacterized protein PSANT_04409 [Moesziomyces antarcticus]
MVGRSSVLDRDGRLALNRLGAQVKAARPAERRAPAASAGCIDLPPWREAGVRTHFQKKTRPRKRQGPIYTRSCDADAGLARVETPTKHRQTDCTCWYRAACSCRLSLRPEKKRWREMRAREADKGACRLSLLRQGAPLGDQDSNPPDSAEVPVALRLLEALARYSKGSSGTFMRSSVEHTCLPRSREWGRAPCIVIGTNPRPREV